MQPVNPYSSPEIPTDAFDEHRRNPNVFLDAYFTGTRLMTGRFGVILAVVSTVWLPLDFWLSYQELFVVAEDDFQTVFRQNSMASAFLGVIADAAVLAIGVATLRQQQITYLGAMGQGFSLWGKFILGSIAAGFATVLGLACLIIPGIYVSVCLAYLFPILVAERTGIQEGFSRSFAIANRRFWISLVIMLTATAIEIIVGGSFGFIAGMVYEIDISNTELWVIDSLLSLPVDFVGAWMQLVILAAYMRIRDEELLATTPATFVDGTASPAI